MLPQTHITYIYVYGYRMMAMKKGDLKYLGFYAMAG